MSKGNPDGRSVAGYVSIFFLATFFIFIFIFIFIIPVPISTPEAEMAGRCDRLFRSQSEHVSAIPKNASE